MYAHLRTLESQNDFNGCYDISFLERFFDVSKVRRSIQDGDRSSHKKIHIVDLESNGQRSNILDIIQLTDCYESTDPRDRVFGLIGLVRLEDAQGSPSDSTSLPVKLRMFPDYTKEPSTVLCETFKWVFDNRKKPGNPKSS